MVYIYSGDGIVRGVPSSVTPTVTVVVSPSTVTPTVTVTPSWDSSNVWDMHVEVSTNSEDFDVEYATVTAAGFYPQEVSSSEFTGFDVTMTEVPDYVSNLSDGTNDYPIKAKVVADTNSGYDVKMWTGTKAQYDAIVSKDSDTIYNVEDTTSPIISILDSLYPVGAVYFGTMSTCPLQTLGVGTWQALPPDKVIQIAGTRGSVGSTVNESLPNIKSTGTIGEGGRYYSSGNSNSALFASNFINNAPFDGNYKAYANLNFDASRYSSTYQDNAPVQQDAYLLNGWRRIA